MFSNFFVAVAIQFSNDTLEGSHAVGGETVRNHDGATVMLYNEKLMYGLEERAHRKSHPLPIVTSEKIELLFITLDNFKPFMTCPIKVNLFPIHSDFAIFSLIKGFLTGRLPLNPEACKRRRIVLNEEAGSVRKTRLRLRVTHA